MNRVLRGRPEDLAEYGDEVERHINNAKAFLTVSQDMERYEGKSFRGFSVDEAEAYTGVVESRIDTLKNLKAKL